MTKQPSWAKPDKPLSQLILYGFAGGVAAVVDIGSFWGFVELLGIDYRLGVFFSFTLGALVNFVMSNALVFERASLSVFKSCVRHYISCLGGLVVNMGMMILLVEVVVGDDMMLISKIIATGVAFFVNFTLVKFYAFDGTMSLRKKLKGIFS
ncbi:MAG: GtrA family protein [Pseudohongiellaceae bacterium]